MRLLLALVVCVLFLPQVSLACTCVDRRLDESGKILAARDRALTVLVARVQSLGDGSEVRSGNAEILEVVKGEATVSGVIPVQLDHRTGYSSSCGGRVEMEEGDYLLLFLHEGETLITHDAFHYCSRNRVAKDRAQFTDELRVMQSSPSES